MNSSKEGKSRDVPFRSALALFSLRAFYYSVTSFSIRKCKSFPNLRKRLELLTSLCYRTGSLFETDPLLLAVRELPYWVGAGFSTVVYGYTSSKFKSIRVPLGVGFLLLTAGVIGLATVQPGQSTNAIVLGGLAGIGFGGPLVLIVAGVQLAIPHHLIATATAVTTSARAVAATVFTAIYAAAASNRADRLIPEYVSSAALGAGLPAKSLPDFIPAFAANDQPAIAAVTGVTPAILAASASALKQAFADSFRVSSTACNTDQS